MPPAIKDEKLVFDVWFLYGSVSFGFECSLLSCTPDSACLRPQVSAVEDLSHMLNFVEKIFKTPKDLVRIELCYFNGAGSANAHINANGVRSFKLFTDRLPSVQDRDGQLVELRLLHLRAETPHDESNWTQLVQWKAKTLLS